MVQSLKSSCAVASFVWARTYKQILAFKHVTDLTKFKRVITKRTLLTARCSVNIIKVHFVRFRITRKSIGSPVYYFCLPSGLCVRKIYASELIAFRPKLVVSLRRDLTTAKQLNFECDLVRNAFAVTSSSPLIHLDRLTGTKMMYLPRNTSYYFRDTIYYCSTNLSSRYYC